MITEEEIKLIVAASDDNPKLKKELLNLQAFEHMLDKYYDFADAMDAYYPTLVATYTPWKDVDMYCYKLYTRNAHDRTAQGFEGKAMMFFELADAHKQCILEGAKKIREYLEDSLDDFFGLGY